MQVKKHMKNGKNVSMGFGFVEFDSVDAATNVCKDLQVRNFSTCTYQLDNSSNVG